MAGMNEFNPKSDPSIYGLPERLRQQAERTLTPIVKPAENAARNPTGPQAKLSKSPYDVKDLRFPTDVAINPANRHWIKFIPLIQQKGTYSVKTSPGAADLNASQGLNTRQSPEISDAALGLGVLKTADSLLSGDFGTARDMAKVADPELAVSDRITAGQRLAGQTSAALAQVALAKNIVSRIDLSRKTSRAAAFISLYMPDTVNFTTVNDYDTISLTQALGKVGLAATAGADMERLVKEFFSDTQSGLGSPGLREAAGFLGEQTGLFGAGITDVLLFSAGLAQNPQMEVLFKATRNREFLFDFKFTPKSAAESASIKNIIQTFRFHAAPEISQIGARYFVPPDEFDIEFMYGSSANPHLPKISSCVLEGIDVNYASAGQWATFRGGAPVEVSMQLRFKEVEILNKKTISEGF